MAYTTFKTVSFGSSRTALSSLGYQLLNADGTANGTRVSTGIINLGGGTYSASVEFPTGFRGAILWNDLSAGLSAVEEINPEQHEYPAITAAVAAGQATGAGTGIEVFRDPAGNVRARVTVDENGNRSMVVYE